jgi:aspartyl-tRNA(Asn)/glutamyl-tRNA(Gln) amidotransferase subunit C
MRISEGDVEHIARLARLELDPEERRRYTEQLSDILNYIDELNELDTSSVEPTSHVIPIKNVMRDDLPQPSLPLDEALGNAPQRKGNFYRVPRIID